MKVYYIITYAEVFASGRIDCGLIRICDNERDVKDEIENWRLNLELEHFYLDEVKDLQTGVKYTFYDDRGSMYIIKSMMLSEYDLLNVYMYGIK